MGVIGARLKCDSLKHETRFHDVIFHFPNSFNLRMQTVVFIQDNPKGDNEGLSQSSRKIWLTKNNFYIFAL